MFLVKMKRVIRRKKKKKKKKKYIDELLNQLEIIYSYRIMTGYSYSNNGLIPKIDLGFRQDWHCWIMPLM